MRKIETRMNQTIRRGGNFSNGNTSVQTVSYLDSQGVYNQESKVFLHGNHIATYDHTSKELSLFDGGWQSNTCLLYTSPSPRDRTRSRMPSSA